ncbi:MAG: class II aldolase/adducin family protein [Verrucomicrobiae bacterium]|nr:class II aldolase/adducin family protein [Verrucomicrobiae bacterium]MCX7723296.1 class II aldolase/adducin family protein [Verrucomicrobiae bacterium]MDW7979864.1 class II aldolase/adducin family protein [Verrucomicrobiales bacterium]
MRNQVIKDLLALSHELGREERGLAILGEGNTSAKLDANTFFVKASGTCLGTLKRQDIVECRADKVLPLLDKGELTDAQIDEALMAARVDPKAKKPSVETVFHAYLLSLPGINFVGHTHSTTVMQVLCSPRAQEFAEQRLMPDEIVCCGVASVFVPYTDPGLKLARVIRDRTEAFIKTHQRQPRIILMQNHGVIGLGGTWQAVLSAMLMVEKAAKIFVGAAALGGPVFINRDNVLRIAGRPDELYRQRALGL